MRLIDAELLKHEMIMESVKPILARRYILSIIDDAPTIEAEPVRRGRWVPFDLTWGRSVYSCTCCKEAMEVPCVCGEPMFKFCPNCGSRMEEQE